MYREPAPPAGVVELDLEGPDVPDAASLGCAAASAMAGAALLGSPEIALLAGTGVLGAIGRAVRARWHRARLEALRAFVGQRVYVDERSYTSLDGERRVRFSAEDLHPRFERLDPARGVTLSSHTTRDRFIRGPYAETPRSSWYADVHGRCVRQVCFRGRPPELGGHVRALDIRLVRVRVVDRGVQVLRATERGESAGDTWHRTMDEARRQIEHELGPHAGPLRYGDRALPSGRVDPPWVG